jgi:hypothetical protein
LELIQWLAAADGALAIERRTSAVPAAGGAAVSAGAEGEGPDAD